MEIDVKWMRRNPNLRFSYNPKFLTLNSSSSILHSPIHEDIMGSAGHFHSPPQSLSLFDNDHIIHQKSSLRPPACNTYAASIARAVCSHKSIIQANSVNKIRELKTISTISKHSADIDKHEKSAARKLLKMIRHKCKLRLRDLKDPCKGEIMRALDEHFIIELLNKYNGYTLSVDAILALVGCTGSASTSQSKGINYMNEKNSFSSSIDGENLFTSETVTSSYLPQLLSPKRIRSVSPVKLIIGAGYRQYAPEDFKLMIDVEERAIGDDQVEYSFVDRSETGHYNGSNHRRGNSSMILSSDSILESEVNKWTLAPFVSPNKPDFLQPKEDISDETKLASIHVFPNRMYTESSIKCDGWFKKQDATGVWKHTSRKKHFVRPFISTT